MLFYVSVMGLTRFYKPQFFTFIHSISVTRGVATSREERAGAKRAAGSACADLMSVLTAAVDSQRWSMNINEYKY